MEYLAYPEFLIIFDGLPMNKGELITNKIKSKCFMCNDCLYTLNEENITYTKFHKYEEELLLTISIYLQTSFSKLPQMEKDVLTSKYKNFQTHFNTKKIDNEYLLQVVKSITRCDIKPDLNLNEIHFNNGYIDLITNEFKKRELNKHFVSLCINRNYQPPTEQQEEEIFKHIRKVYPNENDLKCMLSLFGSALTGHAPKNNIVLFLIGKGSTGKSFTLQLTLRAFEIYIKELKSDTFVINNPNINKILNSYDKEPTPRISWINEMEDKRVDDSLFKQFPEGQIQTTKLYKDDIYTIHHYSMLIVTLNTMLNIKIDTGTARRIKSNYHKSEFVDEIEKVNETNHIYFKNKNLLDEIINNKLLDAWVSILCRYACEWNKTKIIPYTKAFLDSENEIKDTNDIFQDFIEAKIIITNDPNDRIHKDEIFEVFRLMYPKRQLTDMQIINSMKDKSIEYSYNLRKTHFKTRGCFTGVKMKEFGDEENDIDLTTITNNQAIEINELKLRNQILEQKNQILEQQLQGQKIITDYVIPVEDVSIFKSLRK